MCEYNEGKELEQVDLEENEGISIEGLSKEQLIDTIYSLLNSKEKEIELDNSVITESASFQRGVEKASYYAGFYNCLINCGLSTQDAYELTMNQNTCDNNQKLQEIVNKGSVDVAKIQDEKQSM